MKNGSIILVGSGLGPGGTERALSMLANKFDTIGIDVTILLAFKTTVFYDINPSIKILMPSNSKRRTLYFWHVIKTVFFLRKQIRNSRSKLILSLNDWINPIVILASFFLDKRVIISDRTSPTRNLGVRNRLLKKILYPFANGAIAQTERARKYLEEFLASNKVITIPNPVNAITHNSVTKKNIIITVGRLAIEKGHLTLIKAFANLASNDWQLVIIGDGPEKSNLLESAIRLGISSRVHFMGHLKDFGGYLSESEIFVLPSIYEGFPNALLEAMSVPLACISSDCIAGPREIIQHEKNGLLVKPGDVTELQEAIERLIENPQMRATLANEAYKVRDRYDFDTIADEYIKFIFI